MNSSIFAAWSASSKRTKAQQYLPGAQEPQLLEKAGAKGAGEPDSTGAPAPGEGRQRAQMFEEGLGFVEGGFTGKRDPPRCCRCGRDAAKIKLFEKSKNILICPSCNRKGTMISRNFQWPPPSFALSTKKFQEDFWKGLDSYDHQKKSQVEMYIINQLVIARTERLRETKGGAWKPLSVWEKEGYDADAVEAHNDSQWNDDLKCMCYRIRITASYEENVEEAVRSELHKHQADRDDEASDRASADREGKKADGSRSRTHSRSRSRGKKSRSKSRGKKDRSKSSTKKSRSKSREKDRSRSRKKDRSKSRKRKRSRSRRKKSRSDSRKKDRSKSRKKDRSKSRRRSSEKERSKSRRRREEKEKKEKDRKEKSRLAKEKKESEKQARANHKLASKIMNQNSALITELETDLADAMAKECPTWAVKEARRHLQKLKSLQQAAQATLRDNTLSVGTTEETLKKDTADAAAASKAFSESLAHVSWVRIGTTPAHLVPRFPSLRSGPPGLNKQT